jgi:ABC-2 type transport system ATP-binding protein
MIEPHRLTKRFGPVTAVDELSVTVRPGRVTGFLGPNGAGKTATMRLILGLDAPTSGTAPVGGRRYGQLIRPLRHVGSVLDATAVHGGRTAMTTSCQSQSATGSAATASCRCWNSPAATPEWRPWS